MLNLLLALYLLILFPVLNLWRSLRPKKQKPVRPRWQRYWSLSWHALALLAVLALGSKQAGYGMPELGFDLPLSTAGAWGLGFAVLLVGGLFVAGTFLDARKSPEVRAAQERKLLESPLPWPRTPAEAIAFGASMTLMTAAWEILYRGFLLRLLAPMVGLPVAIAASALAYGAGHGYKNPKQLIGSVISAFVFTIAYALTHSLWWLILIHAGLPLSAIPAALRAQRAQSCRDDTGSVSGIEP